MSDNTTQHNQETVIFTEEELKIIALAKHLDIAPEVITQSTKHDTCVFDTHQNNHWMEEYLVCTDEEATDHTGDYIKDSLWTFNADVIIKYSELPWEAEEMIISFQRDKCEDANSTIASLITDVDEFIDYVICVGGRGHFLNFHDGKEYESNGFFIYQQ